MSALSRAATTHLALKDANTTSDYDPAKSEDNRFLGVQLVPTRNRTINEFSSVCISIESTSSSDNANSCNYDDYMVLGEAGIEPA
jgi:hypothetical protein